MTKEPHADNKPQYTQYDVCLCVSRRGEPIIENGKITYKKKTYRKVNVEKKYD